MIKVEVHSTRAAIRSQEPLTVGLRGAKARFVFGADWDSLIKTAVFRQGEKTVTVADIGQEVTIPWEVLTMAGVPVQIGVYGKDAPGTVAIPTLWVSTEPVQPGADPEGDPTTEYTQPFWEQILQKTGTMEQLQTDAKSSLVAAINEANRPVQMVYVGMDTDGFNTSHFANEIQRLIDNGIPMACYWHEKNVVAHLSEFQTGGPFVFTTVSDAVAYRIVIHDDNSVECSEMELTKKTDLPTKTSQLKNDSGYLTKAPVTGVNGKTGDVTIPTPIRVTIEKLADGSYQPDPPYDEIVEFHDQGNLLYCQYENLELPLTGVVPHFYTFSCIDGGKVHRVKLGPSSVTVSSENVASGGNSGAVDAVLYTPQELTEEQKTQARLNLGIQEPLEVEVILTSPGANLVDTSVKNVFNAIADGRTVLLYRYTDSGDRIYYTLTKRFADPNGGDSITFTYTNFEGDQHIILTLGGLIDGGFGSIGVGTELISANSVGAVPAPLTAEIGQAMCVTAVDENGQPTEWGAADLPTGGEGSNNTFRFELTLEEDVSSAKLTLPVNWGQVLQFNIHMDTNFTTDMEWTTNAGGAYNKRGTLSNGLKGLNFYGTRYTWSDDRTLFCIGLTSAYNASGVARPKIGDENINPSNKHNYFEFISTTEGAVFPAGTRFMVWGVYEP